MTFGYGYIYPLDDFGEHALENPTKDGNDGDGTQMASRIPPWYIRGLWSQSLLGDLGGSIRLTLSRVPTLQMYVYECFNTFFLCVMGYFTENSCMKPDLR